MTYRHLGLRAVALALRRTILFALLATSALAPLLFSQAKVQALRSARHLRHLEEPRRIRSHHRQQSSSHDGMGKREVE